MKIRSNRRLLGLMLTPFALFTACVGLSPEEQVEYNQLKSEVQRIQAEEIGPRQQQLHEIATGGIVVDVNQLQAQVNQIRSEKLAPLEHRLSGLQSGSEVLAAPGTKIELEELNRKLQELEQLSAGLKSQISEYREQLEVAQLASGEQLEEQISLLEIELDALNLQLAELFRDTDLQAAEIDASLADLRELLETLEADSADADEARTGIAEFEAEWEAIHQGESAMMAELEDAIEAVKAEIAVLRAEINGHNESLANQFGGLIHGLEISLHDVSEEREDVVQRIHNLELSAPEELQQVIEELEKLIETIVTTELRPLIVRMNEATVGGDSNSTTREQVRAELEEWLATVAGKRARMNELNSKSFKSLMGGLNLGSLLSFTK